MHATTTRVSSTVLVTALAPGASVSLAHNLVSEDSGLRPTKILPNESTAIAVVTATPVLVTFTNPGSVTETATFLVSYDEEMAQNNQTSWWAGGEVPNIGIPGVVSSTPTIVWHYVRTTGSDTTGDGTSPATAWRTTVHALDVLLSRYTLGVYHILDITGVTEAISGGLVIPSFVPDIDGSVLDFAFWGFYVYPLTITATPTLVDTINVGDIVSQTTSPISGLLTVVTTKAWGVNAHRKRLLLGSGLGEFAVIESNSATTLYTTGYMPFTPPITVMDHGAEIRNSDAASDKATLTMHGPHGAIGLVGIKLTHANAVAPILSAYQAGNYVGAMCCDLEGGISIKGVTLYTDFSAFIGGTYYAEQSFTAMRESIFEGVSFRIYSGSQEPYWLYSIARGCSPLGGASWNAPPPFVIEACEIYAATSHAIYYRGGATSTVRDTIIGASVGDAIYCDGPGLLNATRVYSAAGTANGGVGIRILNGCQVRRDTSTVTGTGGNYKVGGNAVGTWAGFGGNEVDANSFARLFNA